MCSSRHLYFLLQKNKEYVSIAKGGFMGKYMLVVMHIVYE